MFNQKIEYKLSANTMVVLIAQKVVDGKYFDMDPKSKKSGMIADDVKIGLSIRFKKTTDPFKLVNVTSPVISIKKDKNKIFVETKASGISTTIIYLCKIKQSKDIEFKRNLILIEE
jgi:hypothetical protein